MLMNGYESPRPTISTTRAILSLAIGSCCRRWRIPMKLDELSIQYFDFYAPTFMVRLGGADLMRKHLAAVSQVEVDLKLGMASTL